MILWHASRHMDGVALRGTLAYRWLSIESHPHRRTLPDSRRGPSGVVHRGLRQSAFPVLLKASPPYLSSPEGRQSELSVNPSKSSPRGSPALDPASRSQDCCS